MKEGKRSIQKLAKDMAIQKRISRSVNCCWNLTGSLRLKRKKSPTQTITSGEFIIWSSVVSKKGCKRNKG